MGEILFVIRILYATFMHWGTGSAHSKYAPGEVRHSAASLSVKITKNMRIF